MIEFRLDDLAALDGPRPRNAIRVRRVGEKNALTLDCLTTRRRFLKGALGAGIGLGVASLQLFPLAPPAFAGGYDIYPYENAGPCGTGGYARDHGCNPGCGSSPVAGGYPNGCGDGVCGECWHRCCGNLGPNGAIHYLRPGQCVTGDPQWDGWRWRCSSSVLFRCHDGEVCWYGGCGPTICRINVA